MTNISSTDIGTVVENKNNLIFNEPIRTYSKPFYVTAIEEAEVEAKKMALAVN